MIFKKKKRIKQTSYTRIQRTRTLEGVFVPGFICNGGQYFYVNLQVFEDGTIDCWDYVDLEMLKIKFKNGWVKPKVPVGTYFGIHHLGSWVVEGANWTHDALSFYQHIVSVVKTLNPAFINLRDFQGDSSYIKRIDSNEVRYGRSGRGKPVREVQEENRFPEDLTGDVSFAFQRLESSKVAIVNINVFEDGMIEVSGFGQPSLLSVAEFEEQAKNGKYLTELKEGTIICFEGLGECKVSECRYHVDIQNLINEVKDKVSELNGEKTSSDLCKGLYEEYLEKPTLELKNRLKAAYELIPEHLRTYVLGDMDLQDVPVKMIIYGEQEIEDWSHYRASIELGISPPSINVPKPKDE